MGNKKELSSGEGKAAQKLPAEDTASMSIPGHLREIKTRLTRVILVFVAALVLSYLFSETIVIEFIRMGQVFDFVVIDPAEMVSCYVKITLVMAFVITSPVILHQIWGFVRPALLPSEKRIGFFSLLGGLFFFVVGAVFAYLVAVPFTLQFFVSFGALDVITPQISFLSYINFVLGTLVIFGVVFEMPMLTLFLTQIGLIKPKMLVKSRKIAILIIFIVAAIITPPDVVSQVVIALPMMLLYEISIWICKYIVKRKEAKEEAEAVAA